MSRSGREFRESDKFRRSLDRRSLRRQADQIEDQQGNGQRPRPDDRKDKRRKAA